MPTGSIRSGPRFPARGKMLPPDRCHNAVASRSGVSARYELARWDCTRRCTQPPRMSRQIVRQPAAGELSRFLAQLISHQCLQFSIRSLFVATLLCAISVYHWPWRPKPSVHQSIRTILQRDTSNDEKLIALAGYVRVGDTADQIRSRLGDWCDCEGHGIGCFLYTFDESGLVIDFHPDGDRKPN